MLFRSVTFEDVAPLAQPGGAVSFDVLARRTHVHVFAMPLLFFVLGYFFVKTSWSERLKTVLVALPFAAVVLEIAHWWLATRFEGAALGVVVSGTAMGVGFAAQWVLTFWDLWLRRVPPAGPAGRGGA